MGVGMFGLCHNFSIFFCYVLHQTLSYGMLCILQDGYDFTRVLNAIVSLFIF